MPVGAAPSAVKTKADCLRSPGDPLRLPMSRRDNGHYLRPARFDAPAQVILIDLDDSRLPGAKTFGATVINAADGRSPGG